MTELVQIKLPPHGRRCIVKDCQTWTSQVLFFGEICPECYAFITGRPGGEWSQAFRNAMGAAGTLLREHSTHLMAGKLLLNYHTGVLQYWKRMDQCPG